VGHGETCGVCEFGLDAKRESRGDGVITLALYTGRITETGVRDLDRPYNATYPPTYLVGPTVYHAKQVTYLSMFEKYFQSQK
jgi:hypothetical protein